MFDYHIYIYIQYLVRLKLELPMHEQKAGHTYN